MLKLYKSFQEAGGARGYLNARLNKNSPLGYGLTRRITMVCSVFDRHQLAGDIVDFGCGDGMMLDALAEHLEGRFKSGLGVDAFPVGVPADQPARRMSFRRIDLAREYPFQIEDQSFDVGIASAFLKHHPEPRRFLAEASRILRAGGHLVLLDPRPLVVKIGIQFGRFGANTNPSVWSKRTIEGVIADRHLDFRIKDYERYWIAINHRLFEWGLEAVFPAWIKHLAGLHQCLLLQKRQSPA
jgi:SAM-dependent methyltransferase